MDAKRSKKAAGLDAAATEHAAKRLLVTTGTAPGGAPAAAGVSSGTACQLPFYIRAPVLQPAQHSQPRGTPLPLQASRPSAAGLPQPRGARVLDSAGAQHGHDSWVLPRPALKPLTRERLQPSPACPPPGLPRAPAPSTQHPARHAQLPLSPGWLPCSAEKARRPSEDASSAKGQRLHVLAADVREAAASGGRVSKSLEALLFLPGAASVNPALATRNRKTGEAGPACQRACPCACQPTPAIHAASASRPRLQPTSLWPLSPFPPQSWTSASPPLARSRLWCGPLSSCAACWRGAAATRAPISCRRPGRACWGVCCEVGPRWHAAVLCKLGALKTAQCKLTGPCPPFRHS